MFRSTRSSLQGEAGSSGLARLSLVALAVAGAVLLASGCGGEERLSKAAYEQRVRAAYGDVQARFEATRGASGLTLAARVAAAQAGLRVAAEEIDSNEPPRAVEKQHEELVEGMRAYADDLEVLRAAIARRDSAGVERFNAKLSENEAIEQMAEAAEEMKFKGFDLGQLAEE
jgi:hypothetical protein